MTSYLVGLRYDNYRRVNNTICSVLDGKWVAMTHDRGLVKDLRIVRNPLAIHVVAESCAQLQAFAFRFDFQGTKHMVAGVSTRTRQRYSHQSPAHAVKLWRWEDEWTPVPASELRRLIHNMILPASYLWELSHQ